MSSKGVGKFFRTINDAEEWRLLLAKPWHWKTGKSAKALAYCWQEAKGFPPEVSQMFRSSGIDVFKDIEILLAFPEYKVPLPGGSTASQPDIFLLAKGNGDWLLLVLSWAYQA